MNPQNSNSEQDNKRHIDIPITHNFSLFLIGVIVVGLVALGSYTFLNLTEGRKVTVTTNPNDIAGINSKVDEAENQILATLKFTNNYDTFDPDATLSDISANSVFIKWLKSKNIGFEKIEGGDFSTQNMISNDGENSNYCNEAEIGKKFISPNKDKEVCFFSGIEPDSDLYLYEKHTNTSTRVGFCGTPCVYETGFWLDDDKFVFLWTFYDMEYENKNRPFKQYMIDMYDFDLFKVWGWSSKKI